MAELVNIVPKMTSNTEPYGIASATNTYYHGSEPWAAFDHNRRIQGWYCRSINDNEGYYSEGTLSYQFSTPQIIDAYRITTAQDEKNQPKFIRLTGYTEDGRSTILDEQHPDLIPVPDIPYKREYTSYVNCQEGYIKYSLYMYSRRLSNTPTNISELELLVEEVLSVTTNPATNITATTMQLNGQLDSLGDYENADCYFQYTADPNFEQNIQETTPQNLTATGEFTDEITGLEAGKTYYFRAVARVVE